MTGTAVGCWEHRETGSRFIVTGNATMISSHVQCEVEMVIYRPINTDRSLVMSRHLFEVTHFQVGKEAMKR